MNAALPYPDKTETLMPVPHGKFIWYELMTTDKAGAETFYRTVMGWGTRDAGLEGLDYTLLTVGEAPIGGLMAMPEQPCTAGARPGWIGHVAVDDVDAAADRVTRDDGAVRYGPMDVPEIGRFAVVTDPQGAVFVLFRPAGDGPPSAAGKPGSVYWHELHASDREAAFTFYSTLFGWTKAEAFDMGPPAGVYQLFAAGDASVGGMMTRMESVPVPFWLYYFGTDDIDAAAGRVKNAGGQVLNGPHQVPGGSWIAQCLDPQGVMFALVGPRH